MRISSVPVLGIVFSGFLLAGIRPIPQTQDVPQPKLQYDVRVALKLVQVSVVDKSGKPVTDLRREDFEISDNGKPVAFDTFEKKIFGTGARAGEARALTKTRGVL